VVRQYRQEGVTVPMDLDYRALALQVQGRLHDLRGKATTRSSWSAIYAPDSHAASQAFADALDRAGSRGLVHASVRSPGGTCAALFDPNLVRVCRRDTNLAFRWDGRGVSRGLRIGSYDWPGALVSSGAALGASQDWSNLWLSPKVSEVRSKSP